MTLFSRIISGEIPAHKIAQNDKFIAFLDINPVMPGHTLIVPVREVDNFFDLSDQELAEAMSFAKPIAKAIQKVTGCVKVGVSVIGLEVPHAHMHLIPISKEGDMDFQKPRPLPPHEELALMAQKITEALV